ncbi:MAG: NADPH-dependent 2,4-dienoyl-CoA reductase/sulfur reductase-like enzyme [Myxococcota bacterium]|jgi:NADPH-dependent 2,4-dienoyl-CoA reductase/sulfur reductase-like enzyme
MKIVIVGNGVAGMEAALAVRRRDPDVHLTIVSEESDHFFSRTALMYVLAGQLSHTCIEPLERDVYERLDLHRVRARATGLDAEGRTLQLADGRRLPFDRLLIACGSHARPGPWPGSELRGVGHFVTLQDLTWLEAEVHGRQTEPRPSNEWAHLSATVRDSPYRRRESAAEARGRTCRAPSVIGGGLIGIEAVETMLVAGLSPHFIIREDRFWPDPIDAVESAWVASALRSHGAQVHLDTEVESLVGDGSGNVDRVITDKGPLESDCVVIAIGVVPNTAWLGDAVERARGGGIVVDDGLQTSVPGVFAAGDCASVRWFDGQQRPEQLWYTGRDQGRIAAQALLGDEVRYRRSTWYNSAKLMDIEYTTAGLVGFDLPGQSEWFHEETGAVRSTTRIVHREGAVIGFNFLGRRWDTEPLIRWINERRSLPWVLAHLNEARFDTEFVPPLVVPTTAR